jgi:hypothetical protein
MKSPWPLVDARRFHPLRRQVVEERLLDFFERRRGIRGLVHDEAPPASGDLVRISFAAGFGTLAGLGNGQPLATDVDSPNLGRE